MLFRKENKIDKLAREKRDLVLKKEKLQRDMRERNSKRETKISILENASQTDYENTNKKVIELDRKIEKKIREIDSEQIYVTEVATSEKGEYLKEKKSEIEKKTLKGVK